MKYLVTLAIVYLLSACSGATQPSAVNGTYTTLDGKSSFTFSNGMVRANAKEASYMMEGGAIKFQFDGGLPAVMVLNPDGSLSLYGTKFTKL